MKKSKSQGQQVNDVPLPPRVEAVMTQGFQNFNTMLQQSSLWSSNRTTGTILTGVAVNGAPRLNNGRNLPWPLRFGIQRGVLCCNHPKRAHDAKGKCQATIYDYNSSYRAFPSVQSSAAQLQSAYPCNCEHLILEHRVKYDKRK